MALFRPALRKVLVWEGGYSNHPDDPGRETNWGITAEVARAHGYSGPMEDLPLARATQIYLSGYWLPCGAADFDNQRLAELHFDTAVNTGITQAAKFMQRTVNEMVTEFQLKVDGVIGPLSIAGVNFITGDAHVSATIEAYKMHRLKFYDDLIAANPSLCIFRTGWKRRVESY